MVVKIYNTPEFAAAVLGEDVDGDRGLYLCIGRYGALGKYTWRTIATYRNTMYEHMASLNQRLIDIGRKSAMGRLVN